MSDSTSNQQPLSPDIDYGQTMNVARAHAAVAREKDGGVVDLEPTPLPLWALLPIGAFILAGGIYFGANFGTGPNLKGYHASPVLPAGVEAGEGEQGSPYEPKRWLAQGKALYSGAGGCAACHQANGEGQPGIYPPLKGSEFVIHGDKRPAVIVLHGINGPLTVDGKAYRGEMPAKGATLTNTEIAQIVSYIRSEWGNNASIVYDDQIAAVRQETAGQGIYDEATLRAIPEDAMLPPSRRPEELAAEQAAGGQPADAGAAPSEPAP